MWVPIGWLATAVAQDAPEEDEAGAVEGTFGKGVTLKTADDALSLNIRGRVQVRASLWVPEEGEGEVPFDQRAVSEIVVRRARLTLSGRALVPELTYHVQLAFSNQDTEADLRLPLRDAYLDWAATRDLELRIGQGKVPYGRQRITSSGNQQLVDRSIVTAELNLDRDVGVTALSTDLGGAGGRLGYSLGVFGGDGRNRPGEAFGYLGVARISIRPMGRFDDNVEADIERRERPRLAIGAGIACNRNTNRPRSTIDLPYEAAIFDYLHLGADAVFKWRGASVQGEWSSRRADRSSVETVLAEGEPALVEHSRSGSGWYLQAGQMIGPHLEIAARYGDLIPAEGTDPDFERAREMGGGVNWYFRAHLLKLQTDWFYLPTGETLSGGEHQVRTQLQLWW